MNDTEYITECPFKTRIDYMSKYDKIYQNLVLWMVKFNTRETQYLHR